MIRVRTITKTALHVAAFLALFTTLAPSSAAQQTDLLIGDRAPSFEAVDDAGEPWKSEDVVDDRILVVYFYPAAMTGGCTKQACAFRDHRTELTELGAEVVGVSGDAVENLALFKKANNLNFPLLSDESGSIAEKFGVPVRGGETITRTIDGREITLARGVTASRWTFVIDRDGKVAYKNTEVNPERDSEEVLAVIRTLVSD